MKRPSLFAYALGNPISAVVLMLGALFFMFQAVTGHVHWILGLLALLVLANTLNSHKEVENYRLWKKEWDAMGEPRMERRS